MEKQPVDISFAIITLNCEKTLERCLSSIPPGAEIILLDSGSTDRTAEIARAHGANVFQESFTDFSSQKNKALHHSNRSWVFSLDGDEVLSDELKTIILSISRSDEKKGFMIQRRLFFMGKTLCFGGTRDYPLRFFPKESGWFQGEIHEKYICKYPVEKINSGYLLHLSYPNLEIYFNKFNRYTSKIAEQKHEKLSPPKFVAHTLRFWFEFIRRYFLQFGFLDGYPGYVYALVSSLYAFVKYAKAFEMAHDKNPK
ncbi:MAG: glycosyltransferase family 2 protein [Oligoflexales bacterium]